MLPSSICSTLSFLIAFSRYPSTASCVLTALGSNFTAILLRVLVDGAFGGCGLSSFSTSGLSSICILEHNLRLLSPVCSHWLSSTLISRSISSSDSDLVRSGFLLDLMLLALTILLLSLRLLICHFSSFSALPFSLLRPVLHLSLHFFCPVSLPHAECLSLSMTGGAFEGRDPTATTWQATDRRR